MDRKRKYGTWTEEDMEMALNAFKEKRLGLNEVCSQYGIPKPTFKRHLESKNVRANGAVKAFGRTTTFSTELETELSNHLLRLEECHFGVTIVDVRRAAFDIAEKNKIPHRFNKDKKMAGKKWYYSFMNRHKKKLALRQPESISIARSKGFNRQNVYEFFDILEKVCKENNISATKLFNVDESGFSTVQKRCQKIIAKRGKNRVGAIASGERGVNTTIVCCTNAIGFYVPPMIIFKRKRMCEELKRGAPPGSLIQISDSGYINSELFVVWLKHFIEVVKPSAQNKCLLVLDGHTTHSKNLEALNLARDNGVIMLQLPGHTTHRLQPLDVSLFKSLETNYIQIVERWLRTNPGQAVTQYHITELLGEAYIRSATMQNAINGFRNAGIWPIDRHVFKDEDFVASDNLLADIRQAQATIENGNRNRDDEGTKRDENLTMEESDDGEENDNESTDENNHSSKEIMDVIHTKKQSSDDGSHHNDLNISVEEILPLPNPNAANNTRQTKAAQKAIIITSTPHKEEVIAAKNKKNKLDNKSRINNAKRTVFPDPEQPSCSTPIIEVNAEEWFCYICEESAIMDMTRCKKCKKWVHEVCAGITKGKKVYICDICI